MSMLKVLAVAARLHACRHVHVCGEAGCTRGQGAGGGRHPIEPERERTCLRSSSTFVSTTKPFRRFSGTSPPLASASAARAATSFSLKRLRFSTMTRCLQNGHVFSRWHHWSMHGKQNLHTPAINDQLACVLPIGWSQKAHTVCALCAVWVPCVAQAKVVPVIAGAELSDVSLRQVFIADTTLQELLAILLRHLQPAVVLRHWASLQFSNLPSALDLQWYWLWAEAQHCCP